MFERWKRKADIRPYTPSPGGLLLGMGKGSFFGSNKETLA